MIKIAKGKFREWITPDGLTMIQGYARDGLTDEQIATKMGISTSTYYQWQINYPEISDAIKKGKAPVDIQVENALLKRALGYDYEEVITEIEEVPVRGTDGQPTAKQKKHVKKVTRHVPPDVGAIVFWLKNRKPDKWRDKIEPIPEAEKNELLQSLVELERKVRSS